jgi:hypothetical protein
VTQLLARLLATGSSLGLYPDIYQKYKMGDKKAQEWPKHPSSPKINTKTKQKKVYVGRFFINSGK